MVYNRQLIPNSYQTNVHSSQNNKLMVKKILLLFSLLVCTCGEVLGQSDEACNPDNEFYEDYRCSCGPKEYWFDDYCSDVTTTEKSSICLNRLTGIYAILEWIEVNFPVYGETTTTMFSLESGGIDGHAASQRSILNSLVDGEVFQYTATSRRDVYDNLYPGAIATVADSGNFLNRDSVTPFDFENIQAVVVTGTGNRNVEDNINTLGGLVGENHDYRNLPYPIGAGGFEYIQWVSDCNQFGDCGIYRVNGTCPAERFGLSTNRGSNFCGTQAQNLCLLGPYQVPQGASEGTSLATAYIGGVIWAVAYFIRHYPEYQWQEPLTDLQAAVTSVAIVKSCTVDMGDPGPDPEHGLGMLSLECLNRYDDDGNHIGFIDNPLSVINENLYLEPSGDYVRPQLASASNGVTIQVQVRVLLEGLLD